MISRVNLQSDAISVQRRQSALVEDDNRTEADSGCPKADDPVSETVRADSEESCLVEGEELSSESRQQQFANPLFDSDSEGEDSGGLDEFDEEIRAAVAAAADQPAEDCNPPSSLPGESDPAFDSKVVSTKHADAPAASVACTQYRVDSGAVDQAAVDRSGSPLYRHPNHREMLSAIELELANNDERNLWQDAYRRLSLASGSDGASSAPLSTAAARHPDNRLLNRYRDVLPYDHSRVRLSPISRSHASSLGLSGDYINASIVRAEHAGRVFAMAQGPLPATVGHFWLMVWQLRSRGVVMLNRVFEKGALKCHPYFPDERTKRVDCPDVGLRVELVSSESLGYYIVRGFRLSLLSNKTSDPEPASAVRDLLHYQYLTWPDFGVPQTPGAFLNFLMAVRRSGLLSDPDRPPVVHCSAGIGRTGSLAVIDVCLALIARRGSLYGVDLPGEIRRLRRDRMGLVQTPDQLRFCYQAVVMGGRAILANGVDRADSLSFSIDEADRRQFGMANNSFAEAGDSDDESSSSSSGGSNHSSAINDNAYSLLRGNLDRQRTTWLSCQHRLSGGGGGGVPFPLYNEEDEAADDKRAAAAGVDAAEAAFKPIPTPVVRLRDLAWISLLTALGAYLVYQMGAA